MSFVDNLNYKVYRTPNPDGTDDICIIAKQDDGDIKISIPCELFDELVVLREAQLVQAKQKTIVQKRAYNKWGNNLGADSLARLRNKRTIEERKHDEEKRILRERRKIIKDVLEKQLLEELDRQEKEEAEKALKEKNELSDKNDLPKIDTKSNTKG